MSAVERIGDATLYTGDVLAVLAELPEESVHCVVTSPPYYALRDYGVPGQIGLEETPEQYIAKMVEVFRAVRRVLRKDGTLWLNIGDSYAGSGCGWGGGSFSEKTGHFEKIHGEGAEHKSKDQTPPPGMKPKDLMGIPWMLAFALRADGWYLRSDIIWSKPNPMPESVTDRPTKAHEYLFLLSKSARYFYDAEAIRETTEGHDSGNVARKPGQDSIPGASHVGRGFPWSNVGQGRNRRTVWTIATEPYPEAHFATFPRKLVQPCILAGCPEHACPKCGSPWEREVEKIRPDYVKGPGEGGHGRYGNDGNGMRMPDKFNTEVRIIGEHPTCDCGGIPGSLEALPPIGGTMLDPFGGSGTTAEVALEYGRRAILIELKPEYVELQRRRLAPVAGRPLLDFVGGNHA